MYYSGFDRFCNFVIISSPLWATILSVFINTSADLNYKYAHVDGASIRYDQSQYGNFNIQIHLKNIELLAILDQGIINNHEYDYDYSEMTERPSSTSSRGTTTFTVTNSPTNISVAHIGAGLKPKPHTSQQKNNITSPPIHHGIHVTTGVSDEINDNNTVTALNSINFAAMMITNQLLSFPQSAPTNTSTLIVDKTPALPVKIRKCAPGYYKDSMGRCRRHRKPNIQMPHTDGLLKSF